LPSGHEPASAGFPMKDWVPMSYLASWVLGSASFFWSKSRGIDSVGEAASR